MKLRTVICALAVLATTVVCSAQTFDYPTRVVDGQEVYEYPVQKGEGLYRISVNRSSNSVDAFREFQLLISAAAYFHRVVLSKINIYVERNYV